MVNFSKYINLKFKHKGRSFDGVDCYGLLALILKEEKNIDMPEFEYSTDIIKDKDPIITNNITKFSNWDRLQEPSKPLDVILFYSSSSKKIVNHMGIFLEGDKFLHVGTIYNSRIDRLNDQWKNRIYAVLRCNFG